MFETNTTLVGRLITPFQTWTFADGTVKISARMACTERRYDRVTGAWTDGQTLYMTIVCKRALAENAFTSLRAGDPLVVHGRLYSREYEKDGKPRSVTEMEAWSLGPDLQWCTTVVTRKSRAAAGSPGSAPAEPPHAEDGLLARDPSLPVWDGVAPGGVDDPSAATDPGFPDEGWEVGEVEDARVGEAAVGA